MSSIPLNLGTNGANILPKHGSCQSNNKSLLVQINFANSNLVNSKNFFKKNYFRFLWKILRISKSK